MHASPLSVAHSCSMNIPPPLSHGDVTITGPRLGGTTQLFSTTCHNLLAERPNWLSFLHDGWALGGQCKNQLSNKQWLIQLFMAYYMAVIRLSLSFMVESIPFGNEVWTRHLEITVLICGGRSLKKSTKRTS
jgi:hypothetical protein